MARIRSSGYPLMSGVVVPVHQRSEHPKVSVIVPVYKVEKYLTQCLNSIVSQSMEELEIIIIDDGNKDRCLDIIDYFEAHDPRVVVIHQENRGYGAACNRGLDLARGEYLAIVESDDWISPKMYEEMYAYAKALDADVVKTPFINHSNGKKYDCVYRKYITDFCPGKSCFSMKQYPALLSVHASLWSGLYRHRYIEEKNIRLVEAKGGGYVDNNFRVDTLTLTDRVARLNKPYYTYRVDSEGSSTNNFNVGVMAQRWKEVHEKFSDNPAEYDRYYAPYLIAEEFNSAIYWMLVRTVSEEVFNQLRSNISYTEDIAIEKSPCLNQCQKRELLLLKHTPEKFRRYAARRRFVFNCKRRLLPLRSILSRPDSFVFFALCLVVAFAAQIGIKLDIMPLGLSHLKIIFDVVEALSLGGMVGCGLSKLYSLLKLVRNH